MANPHLIASALALFNDPLFQRSKKWVLSTSAIFSKHFLVYGWGEVVPDGFGVAYMTGYDGEIFDPFLPHGAHHIGQIVYNSRLHRG